MSNSRRTKGQTRREFLKGASCAGALALCSCGSELVGRNGDVDGGPSKPDASLPEIDAAADAAVDSIPAVHLGVGKGIVPGRVVWSHNPAATPWAGTAGYWWEEGNTVKTEVASMLKGALLGLTNTQTVSSAWDALFRHFNRTTRNTDAGHQAGESIAIKLNLNVFRLNRQLQLNDSFPSPYLVHTLLSQLVEAGVPPDMLVLYDASRLVPDVIFQAVQEDAKLQGVRFVDYLGGEGRERATRDPDARIHWSQTLIEGNPAFLPTCVTQSTYHINLATFKGHSLCGVTLCAKNLLGSFCTNDLDNPDEPTMRVPAGAGLHSHIGVLPNGTHADKLPVYPMDSYAPFVDLMGNKDLGQKTILYLIDGLYATSKQSGDITPDEKFKTAPFNNHWPSSLFVSQDPVAIDSVGFDFLRAEPAVYQHSDESEAPNATENYLHEGAQADSPRSGAQYNPNQSAGGLGSLGVHENWDSETTKEYSGNRIPGRGIELFKIS
jgi:hypothetical protein